MAFGKHIRQEKQSSSLFFKGTVVIFVGFCVLAVWMMNSSSPMPEETKRFSSIPQAKSEIREKIIDSVSFEDNPGDLPEDAIKGDDSEPQRNPEIEQTIENDRTSDGGANSNEEKTSDGGSNTNGEKTMQGDEDEEKDDEKVPVDDNKKANEKLSEKGGDEAESQEKREVELNGQSENGEGNDEVGNVKSEAEAENEKIENLIEKEGDGVESEGKREAENNSQSDNEKLIKKRGDEADSEEKKEAENNSQSEKDEGNREGGNGENGFKEDNRKTESELESDLKPDAGIEGKAKDLNVSESLPNAAQFELLKENTVQPGKWETQAAESKDEKERQETGAVSNSKDDKEGSSQSQDQTAEEQSLKGEESSKQRKDGKEKKKKKEQSNEVTGHLYNWQLCNVTAGPDYIPCLDNEEAIRKLRSTKHYEHRERHCHEDPPTCLVALPEGYKSPIRWPKSRDKIWYNNVPHTKLAVIKKHQNWLRISGEYLTFPGGGTQFKNGALHYIDFIEETIPDILWGKHSRVILDVGCGVASFGGFLFEREVLTMSLAPKDEHEAQVQLALERGIPAISAVMGTQRLPFPSAVFDVVHCARCRVPWHADGGKLLLELNRLLRPGGYFVWSATPIYQKLEEDIEIWKAMSSLTASICWNLLANKIDTVNEVGVAIYQKPTSNTCYESRRKNEPPMCDEADDPNAAWYVPMGSCLHKVPNVDDERGTEWPEEWPQRLEKVPDWLSNDVHTSFMSDTEHWKRIITKSYLTGFGIDWSNVRNVMDMKTVYGGFAAALASQQVWVMNVVPTDVPNTLPIIYERGLFGIYHDWCESFNTYPRTYDLLHADHLFSLLRKRCNLVPVMAEVDRILRPGGLIIFRDNAATLNELETMMKSLQWQIRMTYSQAQEGILCAQKTMWRPQAIS